MRPPSIATSPWEPGAPLPSTTRPPLTTSSVICASGSWEQHDGESRGGAGGLTPTVHRSVEHDAVTGADPHGIGTAELDVERAVDDEGEADRGRVAGVVGARPELEEAPRDSTIERLHGYGRRRRIAALEGVGQRSPG